MGRNRTGAITTDASLKIDLSFLIQKKFIRRGERCSFTLTWTNGSNICAESSYQNGENYLRLIYTISEDGKKTQYDYRISLLLKRSNLGKGEIIYFKCPTSGKLCRILYKAYGSPIWKSRNAYRNRIYYPTQISSKLNKYNDRYWQLDYIIEKLLKKRGAASYRGNPTKRALRTQKLLQERDKMDTLRWTVGMPKRLRK